MPGHIRKSPLVWVAVLVMVAISSFAGAAQLTGLVAGKLQDLQEQEARHDWRRISVLGTVAYMDDRGSARGLPPAVQRPAYTHPAPFLETPPPPELAAP